MPFILAVIAAYCIGSLSAAILLSKFSGADDPRDVGSGNAGATNVLRTQGKKKGLVVLGLDVAKGIVAMALGGIIFDQSGFALALIALATVAGHIFPVFFKFKGGKGVATAAGTLVWLSPVVTIIAAIVWGGVVYAKRMVSLASLSAVGVATVLMWLLNPHYAFPVTVIAALIVWKHMPNIQRIRDGIENKIDL